MPVNLTGCLTPGKFEAIEGVPQIIDSICTNPNVSVLFKLGNTVTSQV
jgi:hypothetical protein